LAPVHRFEPGGEDGPRLILEGTGDRHAIGCWRGPVELKEGRWYRASVTAHLERIEHPALSVFAQVAKHFLVPESTDGNTIHLGRLFRFGNEDSAPDMELYLKATEHGRAAWSAPNVTEVPSPDFRIARVATVRMGEPAIPLTLQGQRSRIAGKLEQAEKLEPDIVALTEVAPVMGVSPEEHGGFVASAEAVPNGPTCRVLAEAAKKHNMYVLCGLAERRGKHVFNTAVLFDRAGQFTGQYDKTHLTFGELTARLSCGENYPVFDLDFARIGIHICYDEWFPEVARTYAHQGVEILFLPVMGGKPITWRTRALDNGIYFVSASSNPPSMIIDSSGMILAETHGDGIACADLNLDWRETNVYKDPTLSYGMPGIAPGMRMTLDDRLLDDLHRLLKD
jgi:predicted amidohydrolase